MKRLAPLLLLLGPLLLLFPALLPGKVFLPMHTAQFAPLSRWEGDPELQRLYSGPDQHWNGDAVDKLFPILTDAMAARDEGLLWERQSCCGAPVLAQGLAGLLYPPNLILHFVDPVRAYAWLAVLTLFLAGLLAWLFLRDLGLHPLAVLVGASVFAMALYSCASLHYYMRVDSAIWLPAALLAVRRSARGRGLLAPLGLAFSLALSYLAGFPQMTFLIAYACGLYALVLAPGVARREGRRAGAVFALGKVAMVVLGVLLAGVQALPQQESSKQSLRGAPIDPRAAWNNVESWRYAAMEPGCIATLVSPYLLGSPADALEGDDPMPALVLEHPHRPSTTNRVAGYNFTENQLYFGVLPLLLALLALLARPRASAGPLLALAGCIAFACAPLPPGALGLPFKALYSLPLMQLGAPARILALATLFAAWAATIGLDALLRSPRRLAPVAALLVLAASLGFGWADKRLTRRAFHQAVAAGLERARSRVPLDPSIPKIDLGCDRYVQDGVLSAPEIERVWRRVRADALRATVLCILGATALLLWRLAGARRSAGCLLFALVVGDLVLVGRIPNEPQPARHLFARPPPIAKLLEVSAADGPAPHRIIRAARDLGEVQQLLRPTLAAAQGIADVSGYIVIASKRLLALFFGLDPAACYDRWVSCLPLRYPRPPDAPPWLRHPLLDVCGVGWILSLHDLHQLPDPRLREDLELVYDDRPPGAATPQHLRIYHRRKALARAFLVPRIQVGKSLEELVALFSDADFSPREKIILYEEDVPPDCDVSRTGEGIAELRVARYEPTEVVLEKRGSGSGWAYLSDVFWPGWKARIDGEERAILAANYAFRAVWMGPSDRRLIFSYEPTSLRLGILLSALALLSLLPLALIERRLREAPKDPGDKPRNSLRP